MQLTLCIVFFVVCELCVQKISQRTRSRHKGHKAGTTSGKEHIALDFDIDFSLIAKWVILMDL